MTLKPSMLYSLLGLALLQGGMVTSLSVQAATGTLADLETATPAAPRLKVDTRLSPQEEARITQQLYERMIALAKASRDTGVINAYLELARKIRSNQLGPVSETADLQSRVDFYEDLLRGLPSNEQRDELYYEIASSYDKLGKSEQSSAVLRQLLTKFPKSSFSVEAHFRLGEDAFFRKDYARAIAEYQQVLSNPTASYRYQAQNKLAWSYYKDGRYEQAIPPFMDLINSLKDKPNRSKGENLLLEDSYKTLALTFVQLGGAPALAKYFGNKAPDDEETLIYRQVIARYQEQKQAFDIAKTYEDFIKRHPMAADTATFNKELIGVYKSAGFAQDIVRAKTEYVQRFDIDNDYFKNANAAQRDAIRPELKINLDDLARHYHALAQEQKSPEDYAKAADLYRKQLAISTDPADRVRIRELLAEALYSGGQYEAAIPVFESLAYGSDSAAGKESSGSKPVDAGYFALLAYQERMKQLPEAKRSDWLNAQKDSSLRYAQAFPADKNTVPVLQNITAQYLSLKQFAVVSQLAQTMLALPSLSPADRKTASILLANAEYDQNHWQPAEKAYRQVLALGSLNVTETTHYQNQLAATIYQQADQARTSNQAAEASRLYLLASSTTQDDKVRVDAAYQAAAVFGDQATALPLLQSFYARYPASAQAEGIPERIVSLQEKASDWKGAAQTYLSIYKRDYASKPANAMAALWLAAGSERKAAGNLTEGDDKPASAAELALYRQYLADPQAQLAPSLEASDRLYQAAVLAKDAASQQAELERAWQLLQKNPNAPAALKPRMNYLAARARTLLDQPLVDRYRAITITAPLKDSIARKQAGLQQVLASQQQILDLKVAEFVTQAQFINGDSYARFYQGVLKAPAPAGMNELETEQYQIEIEEQTQPLKDKAIEWHKANTALALDPDASLWDSWIAQSFEQLAVLSPGKYARPLRNPVIPASDAALNAIVPVIASAPADAMVRLDSLIAQRQQPTVPSKKAAKNAPAVPVGKSDLSLTYSYRGLARLKLGQFANAESDFRAATAASPNFADSAYLQGVTEELYLNQPQAALNSYLEYLARLDSAKLPADKTVQKWVVILQKQLKLPVTNFNPVPPAPAPNPNAEAPSAGTTATVSTSSIVNDSSAHVAAAKEAPATETQPNAVAVTDKTP